MYRFWHFCLWPVYACSQFTLGSGCVYSTGIWFRLLYFHGLSGGTQGWGNVFTSVSPFFPLLISKGVCPDTFAKQLLYRRPGSGLSPLSNWICICKSIQLNIRWTSSQSHVNIPSVFLFFFFFVVQILKESMTCPALSMSPSEAAGGGWRRRVPCQIVEQAVCHLSCPVFAFI